jgi:hypothetical protein
MVYYVDIDETICYYNGERNYPDALPNKERISKINELYDSGHTVVYWTARGGTTGIDWTETTTKQLKEWGVKHHELKMWKPAYDIFICDKAINSERFFNDE